jgi:hypothetical protein
MGVTNAMVRKVKVGLHRDGILQNLQKGWTPGSKSKRLSQGDVKGCTVMREKSMRKTFILSPSISGASGR